jgi:hypothetical protein
MKWMRKQPLGIKSYGFLSRSLIRKQAVILTQTLLERAFERSGHDILGVVDWYHDSHPARLDPASLGTIFLPLPGEQQGIRNWLCNKMPVHLAGNYHLSLRLHLELSLLNFNSGVGCLITTHLQLLVHLHHRAWWMAFGHPNGCTKCHPTLALQEASIGCDLHFAEPGWQGQTIHWMVGLEAPGSKKTTAGEA